MALLASWLKLCVCLACSEGPQHFGAIGFGKGTYKETHSRGIDPVLSHMLQGSTCS